jgi:small subunit ribosomal protein S21
VVEVKRKEDESFDSLLRRFTRKMQQSGIVLRARKTRYFERSKSRNLRRRSAQHRAELSKLRDELKRLGKVIPRKLSSVMPNKKK